MPGPDFWINPDGVANQAQAFANWADMASQATSWLRNHPLEDSTEHLAYWHGATAGAAVRTSLIDWFTHLDAVLQGVDRELRSVASDAMTMDLEQQAQLDALDPQTYLGYDTLPYGSGELLDPDERVDEDYWVLPTIGGGVAFYCDLGPYDLSGYGSRLVPDDILSPAGWFETILGWLGGRGIAEEVLSAFGGRWEDLYRFRDTLTGLGQMTTDMRDNLTLQVTYLDTLWQGFAANSAQQYFEALLTAISNGAEIITGAAGVFGRYLDGIEQMAQLVAELLRNLWDAIFWAAVACAIGTGTIETVVGGIAGYGSAAVLLAWAFDRLWKVREALATLESIAGLVDALVDVNAPLAAFTVEVPIPQMVDAP